MGIIILCFFFFGGGVPKQIVGKLFSKLRVWRLRSVGCGSSAVSWFRA